MGALVFAFGRNSHRCRLGEVFRPSGAHSAPEWTGFGSVSIRFAEVEINDAFVAVHPKFARNCWGGLVDGAQTAQCGFDVVLGVNPSCGQDSQAIGSNQGLVVRPDGVFAAGQGSPGRLAVLALASISSSVP